MRWAQIPACSIAAERVFAQARVIDSPKRQGQTWATFAREVFLRVNSTVLDDLLPANL